MQTMRMCQDPLPREVRGRAPTPGLRPSRNTSPGHTLQHSANISIVEVIKLKFIPCRPRPATGPKSRPETHPNQRTSLDGRIALASAPKHRAKKRTPLFRVKRCVFKNLRA